MSKLLETDLNFNHKQALALRMQVLAAAPGSPVTGQVYYNSTTNRIEYYNGTTWVTLHASWVSSVTGTSPVNSSGGATPAISIDAASGSGPGSMSAAHYTLVNAATDVNTASTLVKRDASGNFTAGQITATKVTGLSTPSAGSDAATKTYVDQLINGTDWKESVRAASTANVNVSAAPAAIDGVTLVAADRVLLKNQTTGSQNGIYAFNGSGSPLTRATDADSSAEVTGGMAVWVNEGTANANTTWILTTDDPITLGTTALTFTQFGAGTSYSADGTSLTLTGTVFSINVTYAGQTSITTLGTITAGTWSATAIGLQYGGTGANATTDAGKLTARQNLKAVGKYGPVTIGDGSSTSIAITQATHGLASDGSIAAFVRDSTTDAEVICDVTVNNTNGTVTLGFATAPATNAYRVTLFG